MFAESPPHFKWPFEKRYAFLEQRILQSRFCSVLYESGRALLKTLGFLAKSRAEIQKFVPKNSLGVRILIANEIGAFSPKTKAPPSPDLKMYRKLAFWKPQYRNLTERYRKRIVISFLLKA